MKSLIILEQNQCRFDFSKTAKEHEATKRVIASHKQELKMYYGVSVYNKYKNQILNVNPVLKEELADKYRVFKAQLNKQLGKRSFKPQTI